MFKIESNRRRRQLSMFAIGVILLAGCSADRDQVTEPASTTPASSAATATASAPSAEASSTPTPVEVPAVDGATTDAAGNVMKALGESAELYNPSTGGTAFTVRVTGAEILADCPGEFARPPINGSFVVLDVEVSMALEGANFDDLVLTGPAMWSILDGDQTATMLESDAGWTCYETQERLPYTVAPGETFSGKVVLDTSLTTGRVVFRPTTTAGWSWPLG